MKKPARLLDLGTREFGEVWAQQRELVIARQKDEIPDTLLFVEHPHVITAGRSAHKENLLATDGIPLFEIERGGDVTYHGPGQLVGYPIFLLRQEERDLHVYLRNLEEAIIRAIGRFDVRGERKQGWTGVWTAGGARKLTSIGVAVKRWVTMHGFALNNEPDLSHFSSIVPCGVSDRRFGVTSLADLGLTVSMPEIDMVLRAEFEPLFGGTSDALTVRSLENILPRRRQGRCQVVQRGGVRR